MAGTGSAKMIVASDIGIPRHLTIDFAESRFYSIYHNHSSVWDYFISRLKIHGHTINKTFLEIENVKTTYY